MGLPIKGLRHTDFCADQIDFITIFAVRTNVVIKRVHYMGKSLYLSVISTNGDNFRDFLFASLGCSFKYWCTLKQKNLLHWEQILFFKSQPKFID